MHLFYRFSPDIEFDHLPIIETLKVTRDFTVCDNRRFAPESSVVTKTLIKLYSFMSEKV